MNEEPKDIKSIFAEAIEKKSSKERAVFLDKACGADGDVRSKVEDLLRAHSQAGDFLEEPAIGPIVTLGDPHLTEGPGTIISRYKLLEKIGEGGMAVVYMAEQKEPIRRKVALKVIKLGMDTKQVIARFEAERQALAMMDHPNIAKVLDAGATETGRPYFVMELVKGVSITEYCDKNKLNTRERLDLFMQVCNAVQHAHQKGIIHRDIKPSNVMVTLLDGQPVTKVIDFGIAKATSLELTEKTLFTRYAQMIGTPEYMSPEQAEMSGLDVDTRTDVYSLGVLLYELLTGALPFDPETLRSAGYAEIRRTIVEDEPPRPSTRLSSLGEEAKKVAESRGTKISLLVERLRKELEWIPLKAIRKDRARRYRSASELADDVRNYLNGLPLIAGPETAMYLVKKFVRRHAGLVATVALIAIAVVLGLIVSTAMYFRAEQARGKEAVARTQAEQARQQEAAARAEAEVERDRAVAAERQAERRRLEAEAARREAFQEYKVSSRVLRGQMTEQYRSEEVRKERQKLVLWIIENCPNTRVAGTPETSLNPVLDKEVYHKAKKLWLEQVKANKENTTILDNAANFLLLHDRDIAEELLKKAQALEPENPEWSQRLGHLYTLDAGYGSAESKTGAAAKSLKQFEKSLSVTTSEKEKFYKLADLAKVAFEAGEMGKAETYANRLLAQAAQYKNDWNYGNAIHHGNLILGRIALKSGDLEKAKEYLLKAGKTPGSPQLNSFGPNMTLAKELLKANQREVVIQYFQLCSNFWESGKDDLKRWTAIIKEGKIPGFHDIFFKE